MIDLGPHAGFIITAYAGVGLVIGALVAWILYDARRQRTRLTALEQKAPRGAGAQE